MTQLIQEEEPSVSTENYHVFGVSPLDTIARDVSSVTSADSVGGHLWPDCEVRLGDDQHATRNGDSPLDTASPGRVTESRHRRYTSGWPAMQQVGAAPVCTTFWVVPGVVHMLGRLAGSDGPAMTCSRGFAAGSFPWSSLKARRPQTWFFRCWNVARRRIWGAGDRSLTRRVSATNGPTRCQCHPSMRKLATTADQVMSSKSPRPRGSKTSVGTSPLFGIARGR